MAATYSSGLYRLICHLFAWLIIWSKKSKYGAECPDTSSQSPGWCMPTNSPDNIKFAIIKGNQKIFTFYSRNIHIFSIIAWKKLHFTLRINFRLTVAALKYFTRQQRNTREPKSRTPNMWPIAIHFNSVSKLLYKLNEIPAIKSLKQSLTNKVFNFKHMIRLQESLRLIRFLAERQMRRLNPLWCLHIKYEATASSLAQLILA